MKHYYINKNADDKGQHEVHNEDCSWLPKTENRIYLGYFASCGPAKTEGKKHYSTADGCYHCCNPCHTG